MLLFFTAGLLPDPEGPFTPKLSNLFAWLSCMMLDVSALVVIHQSSHVREATSGSAESHAALVIARNVVLGSMACLFLLTRRHSLGDDEWESEESGPLLSSGNAASKDSYGAAKSGATATARERKGDAQSTGWVDYFIGFRVLFPYLW